MTSVISPQSIFYTVPVRQPHPVAQAMASFLGRIYGKSISGYNGAIRIGEPTIGSPHKYAGYVLPPQLFIGWNPSKAGAGAIRTGQAIGLPGTQAPYGDQSPLLAAVARTVQPGPSLPRGV